VNTLQLENQRRQSQVLSAWLSTRPGALQRAYGDKTLRVSNAGNGAKFAVSSDVEAMRELFAPITAASGFAVTDKTAMAVSTVYACLTKLAGSVLQLPVCHYREDKEGNRTKVKDPVLHWLLNEQPHARWTSASWKDWIVRCVALRGDQFTQILRGSNFKGGPVTNLLPLHPDQVVVRRCVDEKGDRLVYDVRDFFTGKYDTIDADDMLHFPGFGFDGIRSISAIQYAAKQAIGNALAGAEYMGRTIGEGAMPQIALEYAGALTKEQAATLRESFVATYAGVGNRKFPLVLTEGGKATELSISPVDMQLIESRRFEKEDICQVFGVPPVLIGDNDKASSWGTGIEQITLGFVNFTIKPMLIRWEEELNRKLFRNAGQFVEFELDGLLRGDSKTQSEVFKGALGGPGAGDGYMTINEIRKLKNMPPIDGGDEVFKAQRGTPAPSANQSTTGAQK
jgi:HK97 family phage portal protein